MYIVNYECDSTCQASSILVAMKESVGICDPVDNKDGEEDQVKENSDLDDNDDELLLREEVDKALLEAEAPNAGS